MTIHAAGSQILMSEINTELQYASTRATNLNEAAVRTLLGAGGSGTAINMAMAYGKSNRRPINITIPAGTHYDYNIWNAVQATGLYMAGLSDVMITNNGTVTSVGGYAMRTGTGWHANDTVSIRNNSWILGFNGAGGSNGTTGGAGGAGGAANSIGNPGYAGSGGGAGSPGGNAFVAESRCRFSNAGYVYGGLGGGGGAGAGGGGGGGAGASFGVLGLVGGKGQGPGAAVLAGGNGGWGGGNSYDNGKGYSGIGGSGGNGGAYGAPGSAGNGSYNTTSYNVSYAAYGGAGGPAGPAGAAGADGYSYVNYGAYVTWFESGSGALRGPAY